MSRLTLEEEVTRIKDEIYLLRVDAAIKVEGQDDEPFWEAIFTEVKPGLKFKIYTQSIGYPSPNASGKGPLIDFSAHATKDFIICVDSDYDYIFGTEWIKDNKYVLQTYANSIENIICNPNRLRDICCHAAEVETIDFDFEAFFIRFSEIVYPLFLVSLEQEKIRNTSNIDDLEEALFDRRAFGGFISMNTVLDIDNNCEQALHDLQERVVYKETEISITAEEKTNLEDTLSELNIDASNIFWHIRGKNIKDGVTIKLQKAVVRPFYDQKINEIRASAAEPSQIPNLIQSYKDGLKNLEDLLFDNYPIDNHPFFTQIQSDINAIFN